MFEAIPELEINPTANLAAKAGRDLWTQTAGAGAEPIPILEFDQTLGLCTCAAEMAHASERGWVWFRRWQGAVGVVDCQCRLTEVVQFLHQFRQKFEYM